MSRVVYDPKKHKKAQKKMTKPVKKEPEPTPPAAEQPTKLLELNQENFVQVMKELGGVDVTSSQLWKFFIPESATPQKKYPVIRAFAKKMEKAGIITIGTRPRSAGSAKIEYVYTLVEK